MITRDQYEHYKKLIAEFEAAQYEDEEDDWYEDEDDREEREFEERCEVVANCTCGAWQFNGKGDPIHVADCVCGAE